MITELDSGDTVQHKTLGEIWTVACVIHGQVYKTGLGIVWDSVDNFRLVNKASDNMKKDIIKKLHKLHDKDIRKMHINGQLKNNYDDCKNDVIVKAIHKIMDDPEVKIMDQEKFEKEYLGIFIPD